jgi:hypothetical protein
MVKTNITLAAALSVLLSPLACLAQTGTGGAAPGGPSSGPGATGTTGTGSGSTGVRGGTDGGTTYSGQQQGPGTMTPGASGGGSGLGGGSGSREAPRRRGRRPSDDSRSSGRNLPGDRTLPPTSATPAPPAP